jgi:hypothetical protein
MIPGILILLLFVLAALLMFFRKLPALLALPLMAVLIGAVELAAGSLTFEDVTVGIMADGALRLADAMVISMFGGMLSALMQKAGVAESFVRRGAELAGDNPWAVALLLLAIVTLLFTTIGGLGAVIMVGTIVLPILASIGIREQVNAGILLFGISLGGALNPANWVVYKTVLGLGDDVVVSYAATVFVIVAGVAVLFVTLELIRARALNLRRSSLLRGLLVLGVVGIAVWGISAVGESIGGIDWRRVSQWVVLGVAVMIVVSILRTAFHPATANTPPVRWYAYLIPLVPLVLILVFHMAYVPAFTAGFLYGVAVTWRRGGLNMATRSIVEGSASVIPAIVLMLGIGMLLSAILGPTRIGAGRYWHETAALAGTVREWPVLTDMKPLLALIVPASSWGFVVTFGLLGPLALYRGPLNVWGLGYGVGGVLLATGVPAGAVMGVLMSLGVIQGVSDPTNTANVWVANEVRLDVTSIMWRTLPYAWLAAVLGLVVAGARWY